MKMQRSSDSTFKEETNTTKHIDLFLKLSKINFAFFDKLGNFGRLRISGSVPATQFFFVGGSTDAELHLERMAALATKRGRDITLEGEIISNWSGRSLSHELYRARGVILMIGRSLQGQFQDFEGETELSRSWLQKCGSPSAADYNELKDGRRAVCRMTRLQPPSGRKAGQAEPATRLHDDGMESTYCQPFVLFGPNSLQLASD
ncbi:hypothetical protein K435DRAFT_790825 [Dendrothele bispora CBS 962.96]|uniref:Uncharacterized protein n=1 Tax=Dendrothele bispora (strain CBS 962.96) TaxID=1314807 RepID=A0A4S8MNS0_DENBC|nr:hypothetical protein K435DRAFT_790825 [Dendrothele bispora CBS 962.96]